MSAIRRGIELLVDPDDPSRDTVVLFFSWELSNVGSGDGKGAIRVNLQIDTAFGDLSQLLVDWDGGVLGPLAGVAEVIGAGPFTIPAQSSRAHTLTIRLPASAMLGKQSAPGFNWWIVELTAWDAEEGRLAAGSSRVEVRDWFRLVVGSPLISVFQGPDAVLTLA